jgi:hypothetical protein
MFTARFERVKNIRIHSCYSKIIGRRRKLKMIKKLYRVFLTMNSLVVFVIIYLIKEKKQLPFAFFNSEYFSYLIYFILAILFSAVCLLIARFLPKEIISGGVLQVESANGSYLPSYLGYFFVALSISDFEMFVCVGIVIFIFTYFSQAQIFNPMFLLFGYKFYIINIEGQITFFVISKKNILSIKELEFTNLRRINNYTYIDEWRSQ